MKGLFDEIRAAFEDGVSASEIGDVLAKVQAEIGFQRSARAAHEATILDVFVGEEAAAEANRQLVESALNERRLAEAVRQLDAKRAERQEIEEEAVRTAAHESALALRDRTLAEVRVAWVTHTRGLIDLVDRIAAVDAEIKETSGVPPKGHDSVGGLLDGLYSHGALPNSWRPVLDHLSLPEVTEWNSPGFSGAGVIRQ